MQEILKELNSLLSGLAFLGLGYVPAITITDQRGNTIKAYGRLYTVSANPAVESNAGQEAILRVDIFYSIKDQKSPMESEAHMEVINKRLDESLQGFRLVRVARDDESQSLYWTWEFTKYLNLGGSK